MNSKKDLSYYLSLPYTFELIREDDTTWFARVVELPGCITEGDSAEDAVAMIQDAMAGWLDIALEDGRVIPEPKPTEEYSGKFVVRVSKSLHRDLVNTAAREEVSLNQFIATELARSVGRQTIQNTDAPSDAPASKNDSDTYWPGLLSGVRSILANTGYSAAANAIDEQLCASWFEQRMEAIRKSLAAGMIQDAMNYVDGLNVHLHLVRERSPLIGVMQQMLQMLHQSIEAEVKLRNHIIQQATMKSVAEFATERIRATATLAVREDKTIYQDIGWPVGIQTEADSKW